MTDRVTKTKLRNRLAYINRELGLELRLNHNAIYGGYLLENKTGSRTYTMRMTAREMDACLDGMLIERDYRRRD
jgi:hypothetical protein